MFLRKQPYEMNEEWGGENNPESKDGELIINGYVGGGLAGHNHIWRLEVIILKDMKKKDMRVGWPLRMKVGSTGELKPKTLWREMYKHLKTAVTSGSSWLFACTSFPLLGSLLSCPWRSCLLSPHHPGLAVCLAPRGKLPRAQKWKCLWKEKEMAVGHAIIIQEFSHYHRNQDKSPCKNGQGIPWQSSG